LDQDFGWGAVVKYRARHSQDKSEEFAPQESYVLDVLLMVSGKSSVDSIPPGEVATNISPPGKGEIGRFECVPVFLSCVEAIGHVRIFLPKDLRPADQRNTVRKAIEEVGRRFPDGIPLLDPIENMGITDDSFKRLLRKIEVLESRLLSNPLHNSPRLPELYSQYSSKIAISQKVKEKKKAITEALSIMQLDELKSRKRVLRRLGFINDDEVVELKARVACEISSTGDGHELLLAELLFDRFFNEMPPGTIAAVLSCFIFEEKSKQAKPLREELDKYFIVIKNQARNIAKVSQESKLKVDEKTYVDSFKSELMEVVMAWAEGQSFAQIWYILSSKYAYYK